MRTYENFGRNCRPLVLRDDYDTLRAQIEAAEAEVNSAWTQANRANAKVKAWEATMVCHGLPLRVCPVDGWGPGADGAVSVPSLTTEKLTQLLDRLSTAEARAEAAEAECARLRADADRFRFIAAQPTDEWMSDSGDSFRTLAEAVDASMAARTKEQQA